jgi:hypothetical protein
VFICRGKSAGQVGFSIEAFQSRTFISMGGIRWVAIEAIKVVYLAA